MKQIKVPKEVAEVFYEQRALEAMSDECDRSWFPSLKAIYYRQKAVKAYTIAWRTMAVMHPETRMGAWAFDNITGYVVKTEPPEVETKPKKPRKPRVVKTEPATEGEKV